MEEIILIMNFFPMFVLLCCAHNGFSVPLFFSEEITETDGTSSFERKNGIFHSTSDGISPFGNSESNLSDKIRISSHMDQDESRLHIRPSIGISLGIGTMTAFVYLIIKIYEVLKNEFSGFNGIKI